jgi:uncharacterized protein (TIGR00730 family)
MADNDFQVRHLRDFLPTDANGILRRTQILNHFGLTEWQNRPTVTVFGGSRPGIHREFVEAAHEFSRLANEQGIGFVTGGAPDERLGIMSAVADFNNNLIAVCLLKFANIGGENNGLSRRAFNIIADDFYSRKVIFDLLCETFAVAPGGIGTLEEAFEAIIFGKPVHFLNTKGIWDPTISQLLTLRALGMFTERDGGPFTVSPNAKVLFGHVDRELRKQSTKGNEAERYGIAKIKPGRSLQSFLRENPEAVLGKVLEFAEDRPRIGVVVSGNISSDSKSSRLIDPTLTQEFCEQSHRLGLEIAKGGGVLVLSGGRYGLREIMAKAALAEGGQVIWIQRDSHNREPLTVSTYGREMTFKVSREFEKAMLFDLFSQSTGFLPGGIRTLDRVFEIVAREMSSVAGVRSYPFLVGDQHDAAIKILGDRPANPVMGYNLGGMWSDIVRQMEVFHKFGFIEDRHLELFRMLDVKDSLAAALILNAKKHTSDSYDLLKGMSSLAPTLAGIFRAADISP